MFYVTGLVILQVVVFDFNLFYFLFGFDPPVGSLLFLFCFYYYSIGLIYGCRMGRLEEREKAPCACTNKRLTLSRAERYMRRAIAHQYQKSPSSAPQGDYYYQGRHGVEPAPAPVIAIPVDRPFATTPGSRSATPHGRLALLYFEEPTSAGRLGLWGAVVHRDIRLVPTSSGGTCERRQSYIRGQWRRYVSTLIYFST